MLLGPEVSASPIWTESQGVSHHEPLPPPRLEEGKRKSAAGRKGPVGLDHAPEPLLLPLVTQSRKQLRDGILWFIIVGTWGRRLLLHLQGKSSCHHRCRAVCFDRWIKSSCWTPVSPCNPTIASHLSIAIHLSPMYICIYPSWLHSQGRKKWGIFQ